MSHELLFRCSSIGELMTEPKSKAEVLSVGAKTHVRTLAAQAILSVDFDADSKEMAKGIQCEDASIALVGRVRGLDLAKNAVRKTNGYLTGECDVWSPTTREGRDIKTAWSAATFPITVEDVSPASRKLYDWQMRGYMWLWDATRWYVDYCLVDTPEALVRYEPLQLHVVSHIPEHMRVTTWVVERDKALEEAMAEKVKHARAYYRDVLLEFDVTHRIAGQRPEAIVATVATQAPAPAVRTVGPAEFAAAAF